MERRAIDVTCGVLIALLSMQGVATAAGSGASLRDQTLEALRVRACAALKVQTSARVTSISARLPGLALAETCEAAGARSGGAQPVRIAVAAQESNGQLVGRARIATSPAVALDVVSYVSDGLIVGGLLCYPNTGQRYSTVIHVPGGVGGVFSGAAGNLVQTCIDWAALHGRTAFAPSLRGQDGGQGQTELCLGEANDVVAAATMLRALDVVDGNRLGLVGGSIGGCVALRAAPRIANLAAVVAFVPPLSWKDLVRYHRTQWSPASELACDGSEQPRDVGGPAFADAFDSVICGHADCTDAQYESRSPLAYIAAQVAPTLIVSAELDNIVPFEQQLLWSLFRQGTGHPVSLISVDKCDAPGTPPPSMDAHVFARGAFHMLSAGPVSSGMLFLMQALDGIQPVKTDLPSAPLPRPVWLKRP